MRRTCFSAAAPKASCGKVHVGLRRIVPVFHTERGAASSDLKPALQPSWTTTALLTYLVQKLYSMSSRAIPPGLRIVGISLDTSKTVDSTPIS